MGSGTGKLNRWIGLCAIAVALVLEHNGTLAQKQPAANEPSSGAAAQSAKAPPRAMGEGDYVGTKTCVACHAPHRGARGNGGNVAAGGGAGTDANPGNLALWGEDLGPLYGQTLAFGSEGEFPITLPSTSSGLTATQAAELTGVVMCLSCHDGNIARGAMMTNQSYEQARGLLPATYGPRAIPTLLGADGTPNGNYKNDHPIGPLATLGKVGVASNLLWKVGGCLDSSGTAVDCIQPNPAKSDFIAFYNHYGAFNITQKTDARSSSATGGAYPSGGRTNGVVMPPGGDPATAYLVCTTCHAPHSMYTFTGKAGNVDGTYPTHFYIAAPYNPGALVTTPTTASSATQFCRQCHFTGAGGSNEGSGINTVTTQF